METTINFIGPSGASQTVNAVLPPTDRVLRLPTFLRAILESSTRNVPTLATSIQVIGLEEQLATYFDHTVSTPLMISSSETDSEDAVYFGTAISEQIVRARVRDIGPGEPFIVPDDFAY